MKKMLEVQRRDQKLEIADLESIIFALEAQLDAKIERAKADAEKITVLEAQIAGQQEKIVDAEARLSERQTFFDELKASLTSTTMGQKAPSKRNSSKKTQIEEPETPEFPFE